MKKLKTVITMLVLAGLVVFSDSGFAAKGGVPGPPVGGETANNLSFPAVQTESVNSIVANWSTPAVPQLGIHYSYGCDKKESDGNFSYPNTSCVDSLSNPTVYYDAEQCTGVDQPCQGLEVSRIYWQKVDANEWWADDNGISPDEGNVAYVDWGDALEAVSWNERSVVRVETQPYSSTIPEFDPTLASCETAAINQSLDPEIVCKVGFQMWHVSGQGITEHWGVRTNDPEDDALEAATSYNYDTPFQIIKSTTARLNLTKLEAGDATCSQPGGNPGDESPGVTGVWTGSEWEGTCTYADIPYTVETSVGGKYVYGFNWRMKYVMLDSKCPGWLKTGYWRLTFYTPIDDEDGYSAIRFDDPLAPNVAPPAVPSAVRTIPREVFNIAMGPAPDPDPVIEVNGVIMEEEEDPDADDRLYVPVVDTVNNLTYLDICIVAKSQGGGGGGKR